MSAWTQQPELAGRHVTLRPMRRDDAEAVLTAMADGDLGAVFTTIAPTAHTINGWMDKAFAERDAGRAMPFVALSAGGEVVGTTRFMRMSKADRRLEIGGTLYAARVQRTGLNTQAKLLLLTHAFEAMDCQCVQLRTDWLNHRSRRAIERLGAKLDGVLRGHRIMPDGHVRDSVVYSIIAGEWPGVRANLKFLLASHDGTTP